MLNKLKRFIKRYKLMPLIISGLIGGLSTMLFFPLQKQIDQFYWDKQNLQIVNKDKIEKRLDILGKFVSEYTKYNWCSIRVEVINTTKIAEENPQVCYMDTSSNLLSIAFKVKYYFDPDVNVKMDEFAALIQKFESDVRSGKSESVHKTELDKSAVEIIRIMQEHMLLGLN
jgi:hypothetical protein